MMALVDGRTISVPLAWHPRLLAGPAGLPGAGRRRPRHLLAGAGRESGHGRAAGRGAGVTRVGCLALAPAGRDAGMTLQDLQRLRRLEAQP